MTVKQVYTYDNEGWYNPALKVLAQESPLEPGVFLLPPNTTEVEPVFDGLEPDTWPRWNGTEWVTEPIPQSEPEPEPVNPQVDHAAEARAQRNLLLAQSDWTQLPDSPLALPKREEWRTYRQALRDIPQSQDFPSSITWPTQPQ